MIDTESPQGFPSVPVNGDKIITLFNIVFATTFHKIFVIAVIVDCLGEEEGPSIPVADDAGLPHE